MKALLVGLALAAGCAGETGVITVELATAPGSTLLDNVRTLRLVITNPQTVVMAERSADGFDLALDLPATGDVAAIVVDGMDASGAVIATGASPRFAFGAITGRVVVYMAAPDSVGVAPVALEPARTEVGIGALPYGAIFAGGSVAGGAPSDAVQIYNAFDHSLGSGMPLPSPRAGLAVGVGSFGVYLFGGRDTANTATATLWRFDTTMAPAGAYFEYGDKAGFARADQRLVPLGDEHFLVTGTPASELLGLDGSMIVNDDVASLPGASASLTATDGTSVAMFVGPEGVVRCRRSGCEPLELPGRTDGELVALPGGKVAIVCGTTTALRVDAASGAADPFDGVPTVAKTGCAAAATSRHLVIAGGTGPAGVEGVVEIYDAATLAPVATRALAVPRTGSRAIALPNGQVLIFGGTDAVGAPISTLELFTPASGIPL